MTCKLLMIAAVAAIALTPSIGIGIAEADGGGLHGGGFHGGGFRGGGLHGRAIHHRRFFGGRGFPGNGFGYGDFIGYADPDAEADAPSASTVPQPGSAVLAVDRPPCHETTTAGVVIERGSSCSRATQ